MALLVGKDIPALDPVEERGEHPLVVAPPVCLRDQSALPIEVEHDANARIEPHILDRRDLRARGRRELADPATQAQTRIDPEPGTKLHVVLNKDGAVLDIRAKPHLSAPGTGDDALRDPRGRHRRIPERFDLPVERPPGEPAVPDLR